MPWVVSRLCTDKLDTACAGECPVDCFYRPKSTSNGLRNQLYISPDECIDCGACEPACPWEAIYEDASVPTVFNDDIAENAKSDSQRALFDAAVEDPNTLKPTSDEVLANKAAHGLT